MACGSKGAVSLSARIDNPLVAAEDVALGTRVTGSFDLVLDLGPEAPEASSVSLGSFSLKNERGVLIDSLALNGAEAFPLSVAVGESKTVHLTLDASNPMNGATKSDICESPLWYSGTVTDSASNGKSSIASSNKVSALCQ